MATTLTLPRLTGQGPDVTTSPPTAAIHLAVEGTHIGAAMRLLLAWGAASGETAGQVPGIVPDPRSEDGRLHGPGFGTG